MMMVLGGYRREVKDLTAIPSVVACDLGLLEDGASRMRP